ncbi:putative adhesin [Xenorhabdus entomophaga]|uniref:putative adhesin n=1 Tax=Xenorhabdus entomophaga TaxID=3136257 RepID=UPI0030F417A6
MSIIQYRNISINRISPCAMKALIFTHGGYTAARMNDWSCFGGTGYTKVPDGITLWFNSKHDTPSVGLSTANKLLQEINSNGIADPLISKYKANEKIRGGKSVRNYSLTPNDKLSANPNLRIDIITITRGKAHLSDIFEAIQQLKLPYTDIYSFACRVKKFEPIIVSHPTPLGTIDMNTFNR